MARAHEIHADVLARADQVAQRLLIRPGDPDRVQLAGPQQPRQVLGVAAVGLDPVARRPRDLARRAHHTADAALLERARQPIARRARLIRHPHRPREPRAQAHRLAHITGQPERAHLTGLDVEHRRHDLRGVHVETDQGPSLHHGRLLLCGCGRRARTSRAAQPPTIAWGTGPTYRTGRTSPPYGLALLDRFAEKATA